MRDSKFRRVMAKKAREKKRLAKAVRHLQEIKFERRTTNATHR